MQLFLTAWNQWTVVPMTFGGGLQGSKTVTWYEGMDHAKLAATVQLMKVTMTEELMMDLRMMEAAARVVRNRRAAG